MATLSNPTPEPKPPSNPRPEATFAQYMLDFTAFAESFVPVGRLVLSGVIIAYMWPKLVRTYRETKVNAATKRAMDRYSGALAPDEEEDIAQRLADKLRS